MHFSYVQCCVCKYVSYCVFVGWTPIIDLIDRIQSTHIQSIQHSSFIESTDCPSLVFLYHQLQSVCPTNLLLSRGEWDGRWTGLHALLILEIFRKSFPHFYPSSFLTSHERICWIFSICISKASTRISDFKWE